MRAPARLLLLVALAAVLAACAGHPINPKLEAYDKTAGYRYQNLSTDGNTDDLFVILAFSGGGTRAAAFSYGVMEGLSVVQYRTPGGERALLDDVDVISSVSGGSFTAAYYALFPEQFFTERARDAFLYRDIQDTLILRALWPPNWLRLASPDFDRIHLAAQLYDEVIFDDKTFGDLLRRGRKPFIVLNATDMTLGQRFEFTQDQFDLLCSDLAPVKVATAVAASSAFPGLLSPLTLKNFAAEGCGYQAPDWLEKARVREKNPPRRYVHARDLWSYQNRQSQREYIHLLDGGLADNIGLRGPYVALSDNDSGWSMFNRINRRELSRVIVITANAKTKSHKDWDQRKAAPSLLDVLGFVTSGPMDNYSFDTIQLIRDFFKEQRADANAFADCKALLEEKCPTATMPGVLPPVDLHAVELSFDSLDDEALRVCLENLPTSFKLPPDTVDLLRQVARILLMTSRDFRKAMEAIDGTWTPPPQPPIDPALRALVCDASTRD